MEQQRQDLADIFAHFAGREVAVEERHEQIKVAGKTILVTDLVIEPKDQPVLAELNAEAARCGATVRVLPPGTITTMELNPNRLTVHLRKDADGKYRIADGMRFDGCGPLGTFESIIARGTDGEVGVMRPLRLKIPSV